MIPLTEARGKALRSIGPQRLAGTKRGAKLRGWELGTPQVNTRGQSSCRLHVADTIRIHCGSQGAAGNAVTRTWLENMFSAEKQ